MSRPRRTALAGLTLVLLAAALGCTPSEPTASEGSSSTSGASAAPWFEEIAEAAGVRFTCHSGQGDGFRFPEIVLGGAALLDIDGDDDLDLYLVQGGDPERPGAGEPNRLFRNDGDWRFVDITEASGTGDRGYGIGAAAGDYDGDGDTDLYVTNVGPNVLLRNDGEGRFTDVTEAAGVGDPSWGTSAGFVDYDRDGDLDLMVVNYINWSPGGELSCFNNQGSADYCLPTNYNAPARDTLLRNDGDGRFTDVTEHAGLAAAFGNGMGLVPADVDDDGWLDLFVTNDMMPNQLWINGRDGTFNDEALLRGCAFDGDGKIKAGMGVAATDPDRDGDLDLLVVNLVRQADTFFRNEGGLFADRTAAVGLAAASRRYTRFGLGMHDLDNDGWLDMFQANGDVIIAGSAAAGADPYAQPNRLWRGTPEGRFEPVVPDGGTSDPIVLTSRGAAFGDLDNDGGIDIVVVNRDGPVNVLQNVAATRADPARHWIGLRLLERSGSDALGARVDLRAGSVTHRRDVQPAYSYCTANDPRVQIGLGSSATVDEVRVRWSDGAREAFGPDAVDRYHTLRRGSGRPITE